MWVKELVRECVLVHHWCGDLDTTNSIVPTPTAPGLAVYRGSNFSPVCSGDPNAASSASSQLYLRNEQRQTNTQQQNTKPKKLTTKQDHTGNTLCGFRTSSITVFPALQTSPRGNALTGPSCTAGRREFIGHWIVRHALSMSRSISVEEHPMRSKRTRLSFR